MKDILQRPVSKWAEELYGSFTLTDSQGIVHGFRKYLWMGKFGITDSKGEKVIIQALYENIIPSKRFGVFIVGSENTGWEILSMNGENLYPKIRFKDMDKIFEELKKSMEPVEY